MPANDAFAVERMEPRRLLTAQKRNCSRLTERGRRRCRQLTRSSSTKCTRPPRRRAEHTIRPRLEAAGANLTRIHDLSLVRSKVGEDRPPEIPGDLPLIEQKLTELSAKLWIIDPLMAYLFGADANKDQEIRRVLFRISRI